MKNTIPSCLQRRRSCRAFLPDPVARDTLQDILRQARLAPSGANLQPGHFHVLTGPALAHLTSTLMAAEITEPEPPEYDYFPNPMSAALKQRQREAGYMLYQALGIERRDVVARKAQFARNYRFFDAPVGIVVTIDRGMGAGCFMDLGMAVMALMLAAEEKGFGTCGIGALANYGRLVRTTIGAPQGEVVVCGIALGRKDPDAPVNAVRTNRAPLTEYATFAGFDTTDD